MIRYDDPSVYVLSDESWQTYSWQWRAVIAWHEWVMMREYDEIEGETAEENLRTEWTLQCVFQVTGVRKGVRATGSDGASFYGTVGVLASDLPRPSLFLLTDTKATRDNRDIGQWTGRTRHRPVVVVVQRRRDTNNSQASRGSHKDRINQRLSAIGQAGVVPDGPRQGTAVGWHSLKKVFLVFWPQELSGVSYIFGVF